MSKKHVHKNKVTYLTNLIYYFLEAIELIPGIEAKKEILPLLAGDVSATYADVTGLIEDFDYDLTANPCE